MTSMKEFSGSCPSFFNWIAEDSRRLDATFGFIDVSAFFCGANMSTAAVGSSDDLSVNDVCIQHQLGDVQGHLASEFVDFCSKSSNFSIGWIIAPLDTLKFYSRLSNTTQ